MGYVPIDPKSPPRLALSSRRLINDSRNDENLNYLKQNTLIENSVKGTDSFFGNSTNLEDEFMVEYIANDGEDSQSLIISNSQVRNIMTNRKTLGLNSNVPLNSGQGQHKIASRNGYLIKTVQTLPIIESNNVSIVNESSHHHKK